ncbi:SLIT2 [Branchiostoma lanceolatum]|uniref:SLIT2 protein n=1 Tax=Branchiostoma lanceolatum TaxID=7740 RepID=A0A8J9W2T5_BRALA|nr:SLIT2 [Branchiostoma lanceolatum]
MSIVWVLLTIAAVTVEGQPQPACDSVGDGSPVCSCGTGRISCKDADLTDVPTDIPPDTDTLELSGNSITFPRLAHLELRSNKLASLPTGIFDNLPRLEGLQLDNNTLESLEDPDIFKDLQNLRVLDLQENNLKSLPSGIFSESNLERLKFLSLHYNALTEIENGTFDNLPSVEYIYMQYNPLKKVGCGMVPTKDMSPFLETFTISCTCDLEPLFDCPEFAWLGYKTLCLSPIWIWRTPLNYTSPDRWGCGGSGSNHTDWFVLAILLFLSSLFISA